jgi:sortase A
MKAKSWLPLTIVLIGLLLLGTGIWQQTTGNLKRQETLRLAKEIVKKHSKSPSKELKEKDLLFKTGETMGILFIPKLKSELPIVEGTDPDELDKGVGHFKGSFLPGERGQIVLSGHRDTVFRHIGELKLNDLLVIKLSTGDHRYKIVHTKIVNSNDTAIITLQNEKEELILTTCYPFSYIGNAPKRYIIYAEPDD